MAKSKKEKILKVIETKDKEMARNLYIQKIMKNFEDDNPKKMYVYNGRVSLPIGFVHGVYSMINEIKAILNEEDTEREEMSSTE